MMNTDLQLLHRYHQHGDASAFQELVTAHAAMVFATALRVTRDTGWAEDISQETFLELAQKGQALNQSVGAWLHRVAWRRACNALRDESTRRRYEQAAGADLHDAEEPTWEVLQPMIDEALAELPERLRGPLVERFLEGRTQQEVAKRLGLSQSSVSRLLDAGVKDLRTKLRQRGVICGAGLSLVLSNNAAHAASAPPTLMAALGKMAISGVGSRTDTPTKASALKLWLTLVGAALLISVISLSILFFARNNRRSGSSSPANWKGQAFCQICAVAFTGQQRKSLIFIREAENGPVIYDLELRQPISNFHQQFCLPSLTNRQAVHADGIVAARSNQLVLKPDRLELSTE